MIKRTAPARLAALAGLAVLLAFLLAAPPVHAEVTGIYKSWTALSKSEGNGKVCFVVAAPETSKGNYKKRGDVFLLVTHRPSEKSFGVVNVQAGYTYKARSEAVMRIDGKTYKLFTDGENAWARDAKTDRTLVKAMKAGNRLVVTGTSSRGTKTTDTFSLSGFTAAYNAASRTCGVKP